MFGALIGVCWGRISICVRGGLVGVLLEEDGRECTLLFAALALRSLQDWRCSSGLVAEAGAGVLFLPTTRERCGLRRTAV
jgi:hypothetical protein